MHIIRPKSTLRTSIYGYFEISYIYSWNKVIIHIRWLTFLHFIILYKYLFINHVTISRIDQSQILRPFRQSELAGKARPEKLRLSDSLRHDIIKRLIFHPNGSGILRLLFRSGSTLWEYITFSEIVVVINVRSVRNTSSLILY